MPKAKLRSCDFHFCLVTYKGAVFLPCPPLKKKLYLLERESQHRNGGGGRGRGREPQAHTALSAEPNPGLDPMT